MHECENEYAIRCLPTERRKTLLGIGNVQSTEQVGDASLTRGPAPSQGDEAKPGEVSATLDVDDVLSTHSQVLRVMPSR